MGYYEGTKEQLPIQNKLLLLFLFSLQDMYDSATLWTTAYQASLSFTISQSLLKLKFTGPVMPSSHLVLCHPLLLLPSPA